MRIVIALILVFSGANVCAQGTHVEIRSSPLHIRIMADTIPPVIALNPFRAIEPGYEVHVRDSVIWITGSVTDLDGVSSLQIGAQSLPNFHGGKFSAPVRLQWGKNLIPIRALDRKRNERDTVLAIYRELRADTTAPTVDITEPFKGRGIRLLQKTTTVRVAGTVRDESTIAGVYVNEHMVDSIAGGFWHCSLRTDSLNAIYVKAVDSSGNVAYDSLILPPHAFTLEPESAPIPVSGKFFALLIGVQKYKLPGIQDLKNPVHDAESLEEILSSHYTFEPENITVLKNPSRDKIMETFERLHGMIREEDNFLIFYAGHGYLDKDAHQGYWWPSDANSANASHWISNADLRDQIKRIKAKHTLLISDACFSGSVFRTSRGGQMDNADIPTLEAYKRRSRTALTSGEEDVPDESVFTRYLIDILTTNQARHFRTISLYGALHDEVISNSPNRQSVEYGVIQEAEDMGGGDFVFIKRPDESK